MLNCKVLRAQHRLRLSLLNRRFLSVTKQRKLLSQEFSLNNKWDQRFEDLKRFQLGGSYEWITSVQKKFIGDGKASAVDVDAAVCLANEEDQLNDIIELIYKLRHTENTADVLSSTEYAAFRFLLKNNDTHSVFKILSDPINYGIFMNAHMYCLAIDYFLKQDNIPGAAEIATNVMKQEFFDNQLLNLLATYSLLKWLELPHDQRVFNNQKVEEVEDDEGEHVMEDDETIFKFPYLRVEYNDGHFDLEDPLKLVSKSLQWILPYLKSEATNEWVSEVEQLLEKLRAHEGEEPFACDVQLSEKVLATLKKALPQLESQLINEQAKLFDEWRDQRRKLIETQAKSLNLQLRLDEVKEEEKQILDQIELLQFFDNRVKWESLAKEKDEMFEKLNINETQNEQTEETYAKTMFDRMRDKRTSKQTAKR